jgi:hypothetical protein
MFKLLPSEGALKPLNPERNAAVAWASAELLSKPRARAKNKLIWPFWALVRWTRTCTALGSEPLGVEIIGSLGLDGLFM